MKRALVTGASGQDGYYLSRLLLREGYEIHGTVRSGSGAGVARDDLPPAWRERFFVHPVDLVDPDGPVSIVERCRPHEVYHLAGQTQVGRSYEEPDYTAQVNGLATLRLLEAVRRRAPSARFLHAASSEMFGDPEVSPQDEGTPMRPQNPYGVAKLFAYGMVRVFRRQYGLFACNAILYNHESPRRGPGFITQQIAEAAAAAAAGRPVRLSLRSLEARRDWGFAGDFVDALHRMLRADAPDDFVLATGRTHSVREFAEAAFARVGLDYRDHVEGREPGPAGPELRGCAARAAERLNWRPRVGFAELVPMMVDAARERLGHGA